MLFQGRVTQRRMTVAGGPRDLQVIRYGHFGRPLLMFPSEAGQAWQPADFGLIDAIAPLIDAASGAADFGCAGALIADGSLRLPCPCPKFRRPP